MLYLDKAGKCRKLLTQPPPVPRHTQKAMSQQ